MGNYETELRKAASMLSNSKNASTFCGSGVSEESGISTFRDPGGLWDVVDPMEVGTIDGLIQTIESKGDQLKVVFKNILNSFEEAEPNKGHRALGKLEKLGVIKSVITQNVDNLHQEAGNSNVIEVHGNMFRMKCLSCSRKKQYERKSFIKDIKSRFNLLKEFNLNSFLQLAEKCAICYQITRPDVVMFGEAVHDLGRAYHVAENTDVMLVLGTSGVVYPVAELPVIGKKAGARIIEINPSENAFSHVSDVYIPMKTGESLPVITEMLKESI